MKRYSYPAFKIVLSVALMVCLAPLSAYGWGYSGSVEQPSALQADSGTELISAQSNATAGAGDTIASGTWGSCPWIITADGTLTVHPGILGETLDPSISKNGATIHSVAFETTDGKKTIASDSHMPALNQLFRLPGVTAIDASGLDTSNVTNMYGMFNGCSSLTTLDLSAIDTSHVTSMSYMFSGCSSLAALDLSDFNTSSVEDLYGMFDQCQSLRYVKLGPMVNQLAQLPSKRINGHADWLSGLDGKWHTSSEITTSRLGITDTYTKEVLDISAYENADPCTVYFWNGVPHNMSWTLLVKVGQGSAKVRYGEGLELVSWTELEGNTLINGIPSASGNYCAVLQGVGNYTGQAEVPTAVIDMNDLSNYNVFIDKDYGYQHPGEGWGVYLSTGEALTPRVSVIPRFGQETIAEPVEGIDYEVTYENNVGSSTYGGWAVARVTGKGAYHGETTASFWIDPTIDFSRIANQVKVVPPASWTGVASLNGLTQFLSTDRAIRPTIRVENDGSASFKEGVDFEVRYYDAQGNEVVPKKAGFYSAKAKALPGGKLTGECTIGFSIVDSMKLGGQLLPSEGIIPETGSGTVIAFDPLADVSWSLSGLVGSLVEGVDYNVRVSRIGTWGDAYGSITYDAYGNTSSSVFGSVYSDVYSQVTYPASESSNANAHNTVLDSTVSNQPVYQVVLEGIGRIYGTIATLARSAAPNELLSNAKVSIANQIYTGAPLEPIPKVVLGGKALVPDVDFEVTYANNVNPGMATVSITGKGDYTGKATASFTITAFPLAVTSQPRDVTAAPGKTVKFSVGASGKGLAYKWQYSKDGGKSWKAAGSSDATLSFKATAKLDGYLLRCSVSDGHGNKVVSEAAKLTISPKITSQPCDETAAPGKTATFSVEATGEGLAYRWEYSANGGKSWRAAGSSDATLSFKATAKLDGYLLRCTLRDKRGNSETTGPATLRVAR